LTWENRSTLRKTCPSATLSTTNPTWTDRGSNTGLRGERPATDRLSHGNATSITVLACWMGDRRGGCAFSSGSCICLFYAGSIRDLGDSGSSLMNTRGRGEQIPGARLQWLQNFVRWRLIFVCHHYGTCVLSPFWRLQFYVAPRFLENFCPPDQDPFFLRKGGLGREVDLSPPFSTEVKNVCSYYLHSSMHNLVVLN
jgi:hypothetical protein